jgi:phosphoribosyl 1,2-cyclic phosphate phosphodiesterase
VIVTFLGTGTSQGVPVIACECVVCQSLDYRDKRLRTSIHIDIEGKSFVIDTGPDFRQQMLLDKIKKLDAVLYTHEHKDHTAGMDDIRSFNFKQKRDMPIYARHQVLEQLKQEYAYVFNENNYPGVPKVSVNELTNHPFEVEGIEITPIDTLHYKLPVFGFRVNDFVYITDTNYISEPEMEKMKNADVLVLNALHQSEHISHYNLQQALDVIKLVNPKKAFLVHMSHQMGLHKDIAAILPEDVYMAYDGLKVSL